MFELLRLDIVAQLLDGGFRVPVEANAPGQCWHALAAWVRLQHRSVHRTERTVHESRELKERPLEPELRASVSAIRQELEQGEDPTQRLTRRFYRAGFNDFLFNTFGIHHLHIGVAGGGQDQTRQHPMSGSGSALLFAVFEHQEAYFLDVLDHKVFDSHQLAKNLVQTALRNWPELFSRYRLVGVRGEDSFEEAFRRTKAGFTALFEVDGICFVRGNVRDGRVVNGTRAACTSIEVVETTDRILNLVVDVTAFVGREAAALAARVEEQTGTWPSQFRLDVVEAGSRVVLRDRNTGMRFFGNGRGFGSSLAVIGRERD